MNGSKETIYVDFIPPPPAAPAPPLALIPPAKIKTYNKWKILYK